MSKNNDTNHNIQQNSSAQVTTTTSTVTTTPTFNFSSTTQPLFSFSAATTTTPSLGRKGQSKASRSRRTQSIKSKRQSPYIPKEKPVAVAEINMVISQQSFEDFKKHPNDMDPLIYSKSSETEDTTKVIYIIFLILSFLIIICGYVIKKNFNDKKNSKKIREMIYI